MPKQTARAIPAPGHRRGGRRHDGHPREGEGIRRRRHQIDLPVGVVGGESEGPDEDPHVPCHDPERGPEARQIRLADEHVVERRDLAGDPVAHDRAEENGSECCGGEERIGEDV